MCKKKSIPRFQIFSVGIERWGADHGYFDRVFAVRTYLAQARRRIIGINQDAKIAGRIPG